MRGTRRTEVFSEFGSVERRQRRRRATRIYPCLAQPDHQCRDPRQGRLDGGYLFGDACSDNLWLLDPIGDDLREATIVAKMGRSLSAIGEGEDGTVYATSLGSGELLRISGPAN